MARVPFCRCSATSHRLPRRRLGVTSSWSCWPVQSSRKESTCTPAFSCLWFQCTDLVIIRQGTHSQTPDMASGIIRVAAATVALFYTAASWRSRQVTAGEEGADILTSLRRRLASTRWGSKSSPTWRHKALPCVTRPPGSVTCVVVCFPCTKAQQHYHIMSYQ